MADELKRLLTRDVLRRRAGQRSYERGVGYASAGKVRNLVREGNAITATVRGTHPYTATLGVIEGELEYDCDCPHAADGNFRKHCVALGLAWLEQEGASPAQKPVSRKHVRAWLEGRSKKDLVELLLDHATTNERLDRLLTLQTAKATGGAVNRVTFERALDDALRCDDFVAWDEMYDYTRDIDDVVDSIEELLKEGHAAEVVELAETALARVESAMEHVDDSGGEMGMILDRLQTLHRKACQKARPDPVALAERLFAGELQTGFDTFHNAVKTYASVLGPEGIARHRELVEAQWARLPEKKPGSRSDPNGDRFTITRMMKALADASGEVEARVAVESRDLSTPWSFLKIAELYREANRADDALHWAERGLAAFPDRADRGLRLFLADEYHQGGRQGDAMALVWAIFTEQPTLDNYQKLRVHADRCGDWPKWREKALKLLREQAKQGKRQGGLIGRHGERRSHSILVEIFLWERKPDLAWDEAVAGGCSRDQWLKLATQREKQHPEDAVEVYRTLIDPTVNQKNKDAYREAVGLLQKIRVLLESLGRGNEFAPYVAGVRATHRPKRNFMALLDAAGWPAPPQARG